MDDWSDLKEWASDIMEEQVKEEQKFIANTFMEHVTQPAMYRGQTGRTPVDSGRLMANTVVSVNKVDNNDYDREDEDGIDTRIIAAMKIGQAPAYSKIYIQNNVRDEDSGKPYAYQADVLGWSRTPAYRFFTLSWQNTLAETGDRN